MMWKKLYFVVPYFQKNLQYTQIVRETECERRKNSELNDRFRSHFRSEL